MTLEGSRDLDFIRECVARNPGGYTSEFRFLLETIERQSADLDRLRAVERAARAYLAHDGSGVGEPEPWRGDFDGGLLRDARLALRAALGDRAAEEGR